MAPTVTGAPGHHERVPEVSPDRHQQPTIAASSYLRT